MPLGLNVVDLQEALRQQGCPVCRLKAHREARHIGNFLYEQVNDVDARTRLVRSLGFCNAHAWQMLETERASWGDALGTAIVYEDLVHHPVSS